MPTLPAARIAKLLAPFADLAQTVDSDSLISQLSDYLDLLLKWNARTNLTAIRDPEQIVARHFGESLFAAATLNPLLAPNATLLDFGSGAGFPGLPIQLYRPDLEVALAESQNKKASFLREATRTLGVSTEVWAARTETMPPDRRFDCVTLRAVDNMSVALEAAVLRVVPGGLLVALANANSEDLTALAGARGAPALSVPIPQATDSRVIVFKL